MATNAPTTTTTTVRDPKSGRLVTVKGVGALKGKLTIGKNVDLTKPISGSKWTLKRDAAGKMSPEGGSGAKR